MRLAIVSTGHSLVSLYGNRAGSREFGLIQHGRTRLRSGQFALIILTFKQFSEL